MLSFVNEKYFEQVQGKEFVGIGLNANEAHIRSTISCLIAYKQYIDSTDECLRNTFAEILIGFFLNYRFYDYCEIVPSKTNGHLPIASIKVFTHIICISFQ